MPRLEDYMHRPAVAAWAASILYGGLGHGPGLADALGRPAGPLAGLGDNVHLASAILQDLADRGLVKREGWEPGTSIRFFGIGLAPARGSFPVEYNWSTTSPAGNLFFLDLVEPESKPPAP